jgi:hypothetical protein
MPWFKLMTLECGCFVVLMMPWFEWVIFRLLWLVSVLMISWLELVILRHLGLLVDVCVDDALVLVNDLGVWLFFVLIMPLFELMIFRPCEMCLMSVLMMFWFELMSFSCG